MPRGNTSASLIAVSSIARARSARCLTAAAPSLQPEAVKERGRFLVHAERSPVSLNHPELCTLGTLARGGRWYR